MWKFKIQDEKNFIGQKDENKFVMEVVFDFWKVKINI